MERYKAQQEKIKNLILKKPDYGKLTDASIEQRIANGELGAEILHSTIYDKFSMIGEDNVLLSQVNTYSVVTDN